METAEKLIPPIELRVDVEATGDGATPVPWLVGWMEADGRACPTRPMLRMSDKEMVLLPPEDAAFSGNKNCSKSFLFLEAVNDAEDGEPVWPCWLAAAREVAADEDNAEEALSLRAKCLSTPVVVHWNRSELSDALSLDESGLGEAGAMQLADLAGRGPRKLLLLVLLFPPPPPPPPLLLCVVDDPPAAEPMACKLLDADETRRGILEWRNGCALNPFWSNLTPILYKSLPHFVELFTTHYFQFARWSRSSTPPFRRPTKNPNNDDEQGYKSVA